MRQNKTVISCPGMPGSCPEESCRRFQAPCKAFLRGPRSFQGCFLFGGSFFPAFCFPPASVNNMPYLFINLPRKKGRFCLLFGYVVFIGFFSQKQAQNSLISYVYLVFLRPKFFPEKFKKMALCSWAPRWKNLFPRERVFGESWRQVWLLL